MGRLRRRGGTESVELTAEMSVGRAASAHLRVAQPHVSSQHASLRWTERGTWELRDLNSKNGTFVDGQRVAAGAYVKLELGAEVAFGSLLDVYLVADVSPPRAMLVRIDQDAPPIFLNEALIALPSLDEPSVSLFRDESGRWCVDSGDRVGPLGDGELLFVGAAQWRCCLPTAQDETELVGSGIGLFSLSNVELRFHVSRDEETVELTLRADGRDVDLGPKACHYALLTLARCRLARDLPPSTDVVEGGWIFVSSLLGLLRVSEQRLNVDIFRIRQELKAAGIMDAVKIIERDTHRRLLRLGTERVVISRKPGEPEPTPPPADD